MGQCVDPKYAEMIHAFELGLLSEADRQQFEQHLFVCESCFEEVRDFLPASKLMRYDKSIRQDSIALRSSVTWFTRLRVLAVAAVLVLALVPIYYFRLSDRDSSDAVQKLDFFPFRSNGAPVLYLDQGGLAEIRFTLDSANPQTVCRVVISSRAGDEIFREDGYRGFDSAGVGIIQVPVTDFKKGFYSLTVAEPTGSLPVSRREYNFRGECVK
jgi:hypothetical protein